MTTIARSAATAGRPDVAQAPRRAGRRRRREGLAAAAFLAPDLIGLFVFVAVPMVLSFVLGFFTVSGFGEYEFIGLGNYQRMLGDPQFLDSLLVTLVYVGALVPALFVVGLALALLVKQKLPGTTVIRGALFLPHVISIVVIGLVWQFVLDDGVGVASRALALVGVQDVSFLGDPALALASVIAISVWFLMGYYMIIFLAGLQDIPTEYYEAARIDGAGAWTSFRHITWPLLKPTSFFILLTSTVAAVTGGFDLIFVLTAGGPANSTSVVIFYIFQQAFLFGEFGYAAAMGSVVVAVLLVCSSIIFAVTRGGRFDHAD